MKRYSESASETAEETVVEKRYRDEVSQMLLMTGGGNGKHSKKKGKEIMQAKLDEIQHKANAAKSRDSSDVPSGR